MGARQDYTTREEWEHLPDDPDWAEDFGYDVQDLDTYITDDGRVIMLPQETEMIKDEAFLLADKDAVENLDAYL